MTEDRSPKPPSTPPGDASTESFTLDELCTLGGVTVRTVRYYISEGLLPPPTGHGTYARYTRHHLDRLRMIGMLKENYLPLREIRRTLDGMSDDEIAEAAIGSSTGDVHADMDVATENDLHMSPLMASPPRSIREESSAADYIADVLDRGPTRQRPAVRHRVPAPEPDVEAPQVRRVTISPEAELLIDEATYQRRREQIETLVTWARRMLSGT